MNETEYAVLGCVLVDNGVLNDIKAILEPDDFSSEVTRHLYKAMLNMVSGIDVLTLNAETKSRHTKAIMHCANQPTSANAVHYAKIIKDESKKRKSAKICSGMAESPDDDILASGISKLKELSENDIQSLHRLGTMIEPVYRDMANPSTETRGVKTRINSIDKALGCLRNDDLIIVGGRPGMGKSAFVLSLMLNMGINGDASALYSLEMSKESLTERLLCQASGVAMQDTILKMNMESNNDRLEKSIPALYKLPIYIDDRTRKYNKIEQSIRQAVKSHGVKSAFIDYLQLIPTSKDMGDNRNHQLGYVTRNLKSLAKELKIPIILLAQLNRGLESRPNKRPMLSDLRDSGEIEQDADVVIFLYRDEVYNKESDDKGIVELDIAKARNLSLAWLKLAFIAPSMRFADLEEHYEDKYNDFD